MTDIAETATVPKAVLVEARVQVQAEAHSGAIISGPIRLRLLRHRAAHLTSAGGVAAATAKALPAAEDGATAIGSVTGTTIGMNSLGTED